MAKNTKPPANKPTRHHVGGGRHVVLHTDEQRNHFAQGYMKGYAWGKANRHRLRQARSSMVQALSGPPAHQGLVASPAPGRGDQVPLPVKGGSYVIPSDVVSGVGKGNTLAGAQKLDQVFPPGPDMGGPPQPIAASGGEYVVPPGAVAQQAGGNINQGHDQLDAMVQALRKKNVKQTQQLPGPRKD